MKTQTASANEALVAAAIENVAGLAEGKRPQFLRNPAVYREG